MVERTPLVCIQQDNVMPHCLQSLVLVSPFLITEQATQREGARLGFSFKNYSNHVSASNHGYARLTYLA